MLELEQQISSLQDIAGLAQGGEIDVVVACIQGRGRSPGWSQLFNNSGIRARALEGGVNALFGDTQAVIAMANILSRVPIVVMTLDQVEAECPEVRQVISAINHRRARNVIVGDDQEIIPVVRNLYNKFK